MDIEDTEGPHRKQYLNLDNDRQKEIALLMVKIPSNEEETNSIITKYRIYPHQ